MAYGNRTSQATTGLGAVLSGTSQVLAQTTRTTTSTFYDATNDSHALYAATVTNAAGESETWKRSDAFGLATSHTGPNGLATTWQYDAFGRKTREHRPDTTETQLAYTYCSGINGGTATCPANAAMFVTATPTRNDHATQIGPQTVTYYDALYRVIATDVQGFANFSYGFDSNGTLMSRTDPLANDPLSLTDPTGYVAVVDETVVVTADMTGAPIRRLCEAGWKT